MAPAFEARARWLSHLHSTEPADRPRAEAGVRALYAAAGFPEPRHFFWFDSPRAASWALAALVPSDDHVSSPLLAPNDLSKDEKDRLEHARTALREQLGVATWDDAVTAIGASRGAHQMGVDPRRTFAPALIEARYEMVDDVSSLFDVPGEDDDLARAESHFWGSNYGVLVSATPCPRTDFLLCRSFYDKHTFSSIADDEARVDAREFPPLLRAITEIAQSAGMWWPYENAAILCDRPAEIHLDDRHMPHRDDGPAVVFRDGWQVYSWNGKAVPRRWIVETESVPPGEYRGFDPTFVKWAKSKGQPVKGSKKRAKPGAILGAVLPADPAARLEQLRAHAGGRLPLHDRYLAGEHREVWAELVALGADVRADPHAADALAVAYETMRRVESNVRTLVQRLAAMNYAFTPDGPSGASPMSSLFRAVLPSAVFGPLLKTRDRVTDQPSSAKAHVAPEPDAAKRVAAFEKEFGTLPLSLRAFYEIVGEVNLNGRHATLDPPNNRVATDPLQVYGLHDGIVQYDDEDEDEGKPSSVVIAPDDLHKANTSGGDAYEMAIPDPRADGELVNERHQLFFVDYLRLCFAFGGFPGYEGTSSMPSEIASLRAGLLEL
jgi:hypothetical protein